MKFKISIFGLCYNFETHVRDLYWLQSRNTVSICQLGVVYVIFLGYFCEFGRYRAFRNSFFVQKSHFEVITGVKKIMSRLNSGNLYFQPR